MERNDVTKQSRHGRKLRIAAAGLIACVAFAAMSVAAQTYPQRPVRMIVPFPPGGSTDIMARLVAQKLTESLGQQVIVDNRGGGGGIIGTDLAAKAPPDGYTLLMSTSITHSVSASLYHKVPYNVLTDFAPITLAASVPLVLVVNPSIPARSVKELIEIAKAKPGQLNYSSAGNGTSAHLAVEMLKSMAGVNVVHVPYKGGGPAVAAVVSGEAHMLILSAVAVMPQVKAGKLRPLAVTSLTRSPSFPDVPTVAESGLPGYEVVLWYGLFAPAKTPRPIIARLNADTVKIMQAPEMRERLAGEGGRPVGTTPEAFQKIVSADVARWAKVVKEANVKVD